MPLVDGWPSFDVVLVGIGADGHLLSVFPGSPALTSDRVGLAIPAPTHIEPHVERVTLNPAILVTAAARPGDGHRGQQGGGRRPDPRGTARSGRTLPAVLARRSSATWLLDGMAAAGLGRPPIARRRPAADRVLLRPATAADAGEVAEIALAVVQGDLRLPTASTPTTRSGSWVRDELLPGTETWLAVDPDGTIVGLHVAQLRTCSTSSTSDPTGPGAASARRFVGLAKSLRPAGLELYTFQVNAGARRFYERHGFRVVDLDDGARNEEGQPDVRYRWLPVDPSDSMTDAERGHDASPPTGPGSPGSGPGSGPPIVLVHGATADHTAWRTAAPLLEPTPHPLRDRPARPRRQRGHAAVRHRPRVRGRRARSSTRSPRTRAGRSTSSATRTAAGSASARRS